MSLSKGDAQRSSTLSAPRWPSALAAPSKVQRPNDVFGGPRHLCDARCSPSPPRPRCTSSLDSPGPRSALVTPTSVQRHGGAQARRPRGSAPSEAQRLVTPSAAHLPLALDGQLPSCALAALTTVRRPRCAPGPGVVGVSVSRRPRRSSSLSAPPTSSL